MVTTLFHTSVLGPKGLRLIKVTDVSLLVEWESVRGAEYYILSYYPKGDEGAIKEVQVENTKNSYLITGLRPGVTYIVQVYAVIRGINSDSDEIVATTGKNNGLKCYKDTCYHAVLGGLFIHLQLNIDFMSPMPCKQKKWGYLC